MANLRGEPCELADDLDSEHPGEGDAAGLFTIGDLDDDDDHSHEAGGEDFDNEDVGSGGAASSPPPATRTIRLRPKPPPKPRPNTIPVVTPYHSSPSVGGAHGLSRPVHLSDGIECHTHVEFDDSQGGLGAVEATITECPRDLEEGETIRVDLGDGRILVTQASCCHRIGILYATWGSGADTKASEVEWGTKSSDDDGSALVSFAELRKLAYAIDSVFLFYLSCLLGRSRVAIRERYLIPGSKIVDFFLSAMLFPCVLSQAARQTADYTSNAARWCTDTGLEDRHDAEYGLEDPVLPLQPLRSMSIEDRDIV